MERLEGKIDSYELKAVPRPEHLAEYEKAKGKYDASSR